MKKRPSKDKRSDLAASPAYHKLTGGIDLVAADLASSEEPVESAPGAPKKGKL